MANSPYPTKEVVEVPLNAHQLQQLAHEAEKLGLTISQYLLTLAFLQS